MLNCNALHFTLCRLCRDAPWCVRISRIAGVGGRTKVRPYNLTAANRRGTGH